MKRREFIAVLASAAALSPYAWAQPSEQVKRIGVLLPAAEDDADFQTWVAAFLQAMAVLGWTLGRNVQVDIRRRAKRIGGLL